MNCQQTRKHWDLFHDSEGDAELSHRINEHLGMCPDCARWFYQQSRLEDSLVEKLRPGAPSNAMWVRIRDRCTRKPTVRGRSWFFLGRAVLLAATVLIAVGGIAWYLADHGAQDGSSPGLAALSAAMHDKLVSGREPVEFASRSDVEVERYLQRRVGFRVHCPPRKDVNFEVSGAGVCTVNEKPAAYIVGKVGGTAVSLFVLERKSLDAFPRDRELLRQKGSRHRRREGDYEMVSGIAADNVVVVVGAVAPDTLERLVDAYGSYHESSG